MSNIELADVLADFGYVPLEGGSLYRSKGMPDLRFSEAENGHLKLTVGDNSTCSLEDALTFDCAEGDSQVAAWLLAILLSKGYGARLEPSTKFSIELTSKDHLEKYPFMYVTDFGDAEYSLDLLVENYLKRMGSKADHSLIVRKIKGSSVHSLIDLDASVQNCLDDMLDQVEADDELDFGISEETSDRLREILGVVAEELLEGNIVYEKEEDVLHVALTPPTEEQPLKSEIVPSRESMH